MKWMSKILIMLFTLVVFSSANAAIEKSVGEIAAEARVSATPVETTDMNLWEVGDNDVAALQLFQLASEAFYWPQTKYILENIFKFHPDLHKPGNSPLTVVVSSLLIQVLLFIGLILLVGYSVYMLRVTGSIKDDNERKKQLRKTWYLVSMTFIAGVFLQPQIFFPVLIVFFFCVFSILNYTYRFITLFSYGDDTGRVPEQSDLEEITKLTVYDTNDEAFLFNALVESVTKHTIIPGYAVELSKKGWSGMFQSDISKAQVFNNIENNVGVVPVLKYKGGVVSEINYYWNSEFDGYDEDKYGPATLLFPTSVDNLNNSSDDELDSDLLRKVRVKGMNDGAVILSASDNFNLLRGYENIVYDLVAADNAKAATSYYDSVVVSKVEAGMTSGLDDVYRSLLSEGLSPSERNGLYSAYAAAYTSSVLGFNPEVTQLGKVRYARLAKNYLIAYNCSQVYEKNEDTHQAIQKLNGTGGTWLSVMNIALTVNWQCSVLEGGLAKFVGLNVKDKKDKETEFQNRSSAAAISLNLLKSNVMMGAERAKQRFDGKYNASKNSLVANMDKGFFGAGLSTITFGKMLQGSMASTQLIRNSSSVGSAPSRNGIMVDFTKIFTDEISEAELSNDLKYSSIVHGYKVMIFDALINPTKAAGAKSYVELKSYDDEPSSTGEFLTSALQSHSTIITGMGENFGTPKNMSLAKGIKYCNESEANGIECDNRSNGTIANSLYTSDKLLLGVELKMFVVAVKALQSMDFESVIEKFGVGGNGKLSQVFAKFGGKILSKITTVFTVIINVVSIVIPPLDVIANFLIAVGTLTTLLKFYPMIQMVTMVASLSVMFISACLILIVMTFKAVATFEPRHFYTGWRMVASDALGLWFYLIGYFVMIYFLYYVNFGPMQRAVYAGIAPDGGVIGMLSGSIILSFILITFHLFAIGIPNVFQQMKTRVLGDSTSIVDSASVQHAVEKLGLSMITAGAAVKLDNKVQGHLDAKIADKNEAKKANDVVIPTSNAQTEGKK